MQKLGFEKYNKILFTLYGNECIYNNDINSEAFRKTGFL